MPRHNKRYTPKGFGVRYRAFTLEEIIEETLASNPQMTRDEVVEEIESMAQEGVLVKTERGYYRAPTPGNP